ncbi:MAG: aldehyde oxidase and xanthine dehydrogenase, molybdopterin binding [Anaerosolibacter sp.]|jgi:CO/xanthine dehydrogenase Mo-binding subunit|uniref:xanthine dehydrogenase family protein molybdopterin-binding subunit n=1 Tax=Anaerosolibacter sp. TaxID=1872527 RepID=UPI00260AC037|nr:xanthine dehydrogenase family protein molybdopterin-binding subunit [Anaerosolibacter sp.]MDF2547300.1 aldehyde oxidase and xanthine dehydrogenase, molybdopterin binding [Anaerosolibacter sp.]
MRIVGTSINRVDGVKKVTGALKYVDDIKFHGMLYVAVKRSPYPHARILEVDTKGAEALEGVKAVITGQDVPNRAGLYLEDKTFLATDKVRYKGEAVAAVAAETKEIAEAALAYIRVDYEELPAVTNAVEGLKSEAPLVHPDLGQYKWGPIFFPEPGTNISNHYKIRKGDIEKGFEEADYIVENSFYVPHIQHCPIENHSAIAQMDADGSITLWASCQSPYAVRKALSVAFDLPLNKLRVISPAVGGGFGGKAGTTLEGIVIPLAKKTKGRPVKLTYSREDEFVNSFVRQGMHATIKTGIRKDGKISAVKNTFIWDGGAYTEYGVNIVRAGGYASTGPYDIPNVWTDSICVYTNHPVGGPYRGFGMSEIHFAIEQNIDMLAEKIGMSPIEIRKINGLRPGGKNATGQIVDVCGLQECLEDVAKHIDFNRKESGSQPHKVRGKGIACGYKAPSMPNDVASSAIIKMNEDGSFHLLVSAQDIGQGSDTVLIQMAAEALSIPPQKITIKTGDTDYTPYEWQTVASRITYCAGNAVLKACEDIKEQLLELAQLRLGVSKRDLVLKDEYVVSKIIPGKGVAMKELALGLSMADGSGIHGPIIGRGAFIPPNVRNTDKQTGQGEKPVAFWTYGCQGVEIEVDIETGKIDVLKVASCFDVGKVINPKLVEGQVEGGIVQGLGSALFEELILENGIAKNPSFVDYKIPTADDMPEMIINFVENPEETGPYGARGVGEPCMVPAAPAIANAVYDAIGIRMNSLPITAEKVLKALKEKSSVL